MQSHAQALALARNFGLPGRVAGMLVESPPSTAQRDIDLLWVSNIRQVKRPDLVLDLAARLPDVGIHMVGGPLPDEQALYDEVVLAAAAHRNLTFHGRLSYWDANAVYDRAKLLVNTSLVEGFPNAYLQAWIRGIPVVTFLDPDGVIARNGLGNAVDSPMQMRHAVRHLLEDPAWLAAAGGRCRDFMAREFAEDKIVVPYIAAFEDALLRSPAATRMILRGPAHHV